MNTLIRNQVDPNKKRFNNIMIRCSEHGWDCQSLKRKQAEMKLTTILYDNLHCFHFHHSGGANFRNFKDRFLDVICDLSFYPISRGLKKNNSRINDRNRSGSRSRSRSRSPPQGLARRPRVVAYDPDPNQSKATLDSRLANFEATQREFKLYRQKNDEKVKRLEEGIKRLEQCWDNTTKVMKSTFASMKIEEEDHSGVYSYERATESQSVLISDDPSNDLIDDTRFQGVTNIQSDEFNMTQINDVNPLPDVPNMRMPMKTAPHLPNEPDIQMTINGANPLPKVPNMHMTMNNVLS